MKTVVSHYGVHWAAGNIAYIEQEKSGTNALGLPEKSPDSGEEDWSRLVAVL